MVSIELKGIDSLTQKLSKLTNVKQVEDTMSKAVQIVESQAKLLVTVDTGNLKGSIHPKVITKGNAVIGKVYTNLSYAPFVEFGTGSKGNGTYPNKKVTLTYRSTPWVYTPNGEDFYTTDGMVAQPYMYPALKRNEKKIKSMFKEALHTQIKTK